MKKYKLLVADIDGTILDSNHEISAKTRKAFADLCAQGVKITLATGRRYRSALPVVQELGLELPIIANGGSLIKETKNHTSLYAAVMDEKLCKRVLAFLKERDIVPLIYTDSFEKGYDFRTKVTPRDSREKTRYLELNGDVCNFYVDELDFAADMVVEILVFDDRNLLVALENDINEVLGKKVKTHVIQTPKYKFYVLEIFNAGVSKWNAIKFLAKQYHITTDEVVAIGDDINDLEMVANSGLGVAMGNAQELLKDAADIVIEANDEDGLANFICNSIIAAR